ncbi:helix-turn-helix transcriptional regulator [Streptomyces sp. NPDC088197]|uniref:helix-turn-helix transcriptional regulator n=1 Tax=Streptomyces sp. NPDC088197 TaxID=3365840 RepID=UPI00381DE83B
MESGEEFGPWLARQLRRLGTSQTDFAKRIGVTRAAVSAWVTGRAKPRVELFPKIADELGVDVAILHHRDTDAVSAFPIQWHHSVARSDGVREYGDSAAFASDAGLAILARQAVQNSLDEGLDNGRPVRMRFTLQELTGERLRSFFAALKWDQLEPHYEEAARSRRWSGHDPARALRELRDGSPLVLLRVDDYNTSGLTGPEYEDGRYSAFVRRRLASYKTTDHAGGSYGLGKATLWAASRFGLVLINSTLSVSHEGRTARRAVGRLDLPWRTVDGIAYAGPAWLGEPDTEKEHEGTSRSWWADEKTVADLHLDRKGDEPGTSLLIVGAYDPSDGSAGLREMHESLVSALADDHWAAMTGSGSTQALLEASVCSPLNGELYEERVNPSDRHPALVAALRAHLDGETVAVPTTGDQVVAAEVTLHVPPPSSATAVGRAGCLSHNALLLVAPAAASDEGHSRIVHMRGTRTTVMTRQPRDFRVGSEPFHAVLLAGFATGQVDEAAHAAEVFLRTAEPPAHNRWGPTEQLAAAYFGGPQRLADFTAGVDEVLRGIMSRRAAHQDVTGQELLRNLLRLDPPASRIQETARYPVIERTHARVEPSGAWDLEITLGVPQRENAWSVVPVAKLDVRSGGRPALAWAELLAGENCTVVDDMILVAPDSRSATFRGRTAVTNGSAAKVLGRVSVEVRQVWEVSA